MLRSPPYIDDGRFKQRYMCRVGRNQLNHLSKAQALQFEPRTLPRSSRVNRAREGQGSRNTYDSNLGNIPHCMLIPIDKDVWYKINERGTNSEQSAIQLIPICALALTVPR